MNISLTDKFSEFFSFLWPLAVRYMLSKGIIEGFVFAVLIENTEKLYFYSRNLRNNIQHIYIFCIFTGKIRIGLSANLIKCIV